ASYRDAVVTRWHRGHAVLVGDAAHAMSPQLGQGVNMAMMDAWALAMALRRHGAVPEALSAHQRERRRHVSIYQLWSRWLTPMFQSELDMVARLRNLALLPAGRLPLGGRHMLRVLSGTQQGLFGAIALDEAFVEALAQACGTRACEEGRMAASATHIVVTQPPEFAPRDLWRDDLALREALRREGGDAFTDAVAGYGALAGGELLALSFDAHRDRPRLRTHDRAGRRIDTVEFHPNYHRIMQAAIGHGVAGLPWARPQAGAHVARAALAYLHYQVEPGSSCPLTMTHAAVPVLAGDPGLEDWVRGVAACRYDPRDLPAAAKHGLTLGMGMTEKQGGSDVRANTTTATPLAGGEQYLLRGHKWFLSAPMSDGFLVLAQAPGGLTCFLMPRRLPDGALNGFRLMRLKDKLGDWSNASSEIEFDAARAWRVGGEGRGVATIIQMVMLTRLDCMLGSAGLMRMALAQALHHCRHRQAFGRALVDQPLMRNVLADLAIEAEAALALSMRVARAV